MVSVRVSTLTLSDGTNVQLPDTGVVLLVGPNNAGKSRILKDLLGLARDPSYTTVALSSATFEKATPEDLPTWISTHIPTFIKDGQERIAVEGWGEVTPTDLINQWVGGTNLSVLTSIFVLHADGTSRLTAGNSQPSIDFESAYPTHPVQRAYQDPQLESLLDEESQIAFGLGVTVDRYGGSVIALRLGDRPTFEHNNGAPTAEFLRQLKSLVRLEDQGDGIRSYLGLLLFMLAGNHQILLIDEPEAFLHPPQARALGRVLAERSKERQVLIATHSSAILQGTLGIGNSTTIVRVTREGNLNHAAVLPHEALKDLWSDPLLRYSNIFDGLFHDAVVLCEGDADCRYYSAVLDNMEPVGETTTRPPELLFTYAGGKARMASVVDALAAVSVPVIVITDFDILRDKMDVEKLVTSLGGDFSTLESDLKLVGESLSSDVKPLKKLPLREEFLSRLEGLPDLISAKQVEPLRALLRADSGWDKAKRSGLGAVPQGDAWAACERLLNQLSVIGLLVVPVGELERFAPGVSGHGPSWVTEVLEQQLHLSPSKDAADFIQLLRSTANRVTGVEVADAN